MQLLSRATSAITKQYGLLLRSSNKENHCVTFILLALIKFYSFKAKSIFSHENDNSCHIKFPTVLGNIIGKYTIADSDASIQNGGAR